MGKLCFDLGFQSVLAVPSDGQSGGLGMLRKGDCNLHMSFSPNHIDAHILTENQHPWHLTSFYGHPKGRRKQES